MITPIFIPMHTSEPERCPNCGIEEDIKEVCKHCNYEYEEVVVGNGFNIYFGIAILTFIILLIVGIKTCLFGMETDCGQLDGIEIFLMIIISLVGAFVWPFTLFLVICFGIIKLFV